jgi:hypothetical protein
MRQDVALARPSGYSGARQPFTHDNGTAGRRGDNAAGIAAGLLTSVSNTTLK